MSLASTLTHTCTITRNGTVVASAVPCFFQETMLLTRTLDVLGGMLSEPTPWGRYTIKFGRTDVREHDLLSALTYQDGTADTRLFSVQLVIQARRPRGGVVFTTAWAKVM